MPFRQSRLLLSIVLLGVVPPLAAGPYETGSTGTATGIKFKSSVQWKHTVDKDTWVLPKLGVGGPLGERLEVSAGAGYGIVDRAGGSTRGGLRDLSLGMKWRIRDEAPGQAALAIEPSLGIPVGASGIGKEAYAIELPLRAARRFGQLRLTGEAAVARTFGRDDDTFAGGVLLEYVAAPAWSCGAELVADAPRGALQDWHLRANVGIKRKVGRHVEWQALAGRSLENRAGAPATTLKLAFEYKL